MEAEAMESDGNICAEEEKVKDVRNAVRERETMQDTVGESGGERTTHDSRQRGKQGCMKTETEKRESLS